MREVKFDFDFSNVIIPEETKSGIMEAIQEERIFGLISKSERSMVIFSVKDLKSWWIDTQSKEIKGEYDYKDLKAIMDALGMNLVSHKRLISAAISYLPGDQTKRIGNG